MEYRRVELPAGVRWYRILHDKGTAEWLPLTDELQELDALTFLAECEAFHRPASSMAQSNASLYRERLEKAKFNLYMRVLDFQLNTGFISEEQHSKGLLYTPTCVSSDEVAF